MSSVAREWREVPGRYNLKGTKCANCGTIYFPRRDFCPKCRRAGIGKIEDYDISRTGEVYSFSIVYDAPAMCDMIKPYAVVMVKTDDGVMITGQLVDVDLEKVAIGMRVRAVMRKLSTDGDAGVIRYGFKFFAGNIGHEAQFYTFPYFCAFLLRRFMKDFRPQDESSD